MEQHNRNKARWMDVLVTAMLLQLRFHLTMHLLQPNTFLSDTSCRVGGYRFYGTFVALWTRSRVRCLVNLSNLCGTFNKTSSSNQATGGKVLRFGP